MRRLALRAISAEAGLPCVHHPRVEDTPHNRLLLAGLREGAALADDPALRFRLHRLARSMTDGVAAIKLSSHAFAETARHVSRLTTAYEPVRRLIETVWLGEGVAWNDERRSAPLSGFLFDMNRFWQALLSRFLRENLPGLEVEDETRLRGMIRFRPGFNPNAWRSPTPRPDFVVRRVGQVVAILDAKYRDLYEREGKLPRDMLYQLAMYALAHPGSSRSAAILFPCSSGSDLETRYVVGEPFGTTRDLAEVVLRPVNAAAMADLVENDTVDGRRKRESLARRLVLGDRLPIAVAG